MTEAELRAWVQSVEDLRDDPVALKKAIRKRFPKPADAGPGEGLPLPDAVPAWIELAAMEDAQSEVDEYYDEVAEATKQRNRPKRSRSPKPRRTPKVIPAHHTSTPSNPVSRLSKLQKAALSILANDAQPMTMSALHQAFNKVTGRNTTPKDSVSFSRLLTALQARGLVERRGLSRRAIIVSLTRAGRLAASRL